MAVSANRLELLQIADAVAREKAIDRNIVIAAMEDAIQKAARSRYGSETEVRAEINPKTGEMRLSRLLLVVDQVENDATQIALEEAKKRVPQRRPHPRFHLRRTPRAARAADISLAHPSAIHGQAVRAGSAGNLRRHRGGEGGGAGPGFARENRGDFAGFVG